jgi:hypothetical protein
MQNQISTISPLLNGIFYAEKTYTGAYTAD